MNAPKLLTIALYIAGAGHFAILAASAMVPRVLDWRGSLARIHPFMRRLFWVYGGFIVLTIIGLGTLTLMHAPSMATGEPVARSLAAFTGLFWLARLAVQWTVFDATPFLTTRSLRVGYHVLTAAFAALVAVYGIAVFYPNHYE
jgi:hypothetical protein